MKDWTKKDVEHLLINPFYAVNLSADLFGEHEPLVSEEDWIAANARLIEEIGAAAWLEKLLAVLQGDYPRNLDEPLLGEAHAD